MTLETAVVGGGDRSEHHLSGLKRCPDTELVAICDPDESCARNRATEYDIAAYADFEGLLARESLDWLHLCTPPQTNLELVGMALEDDIAVQLETPVATSVAEAEQLERLVADHDAQVSVAHQRNFTPAMRKAGELVANGAVGELQSLSLLYTDADDRQSGSSTASPFGFELGGRLSDPVSLLLHLGGYPDSTSSIQAATSSGAESSRGVDEETVQFHYSTADGVVCSASVLQGDIPHRSLQIHGDTGRLDVDLITQSVTRLEQTGHDTATARAKGNIAHISGRARSTVGHAVTAARRKVGSDWETIRQLDSHCYQLHREVQAIESSESMPVPVTEGAWALRVMDAVRAGTGQPPAEQPVHLGTDSA